MNLRKLAGKSVRWILRERTARGDIVFLGDSITAGGKWSEWFPGRRTRNRGESGDSTEDILNRLVDAIGPAPRAVFLLIGTNDVDFGWPADRTIANVTRIVSTIRERAPRAALFVQSIMPQRAVVASELRALNEAYRRIAAEHGARFIDLWPTMAHGDGLRANYTHDQLHLTATGYAAWLEVLRPFVAGV